MDQDNFLHKEFTEKQHTQQRIIKNFLLQMFSELFEYFFSNLENILLLLFFLFVTGE